MSDDNFLILSVSEAETQLFNWRMMGSKDNNLPEQIIQMIDTEGLITGTSADYHNLASEFAKSGLYEYARITSVAGVKKYKYNVDLLADIVKFGSQSQAWEACDKAYDRLMAIDKKKWTWRTFTFLIDYLQEKMDQEEVEKNTKIYDEAMDLVHAYKKLSDERAWVAEAELFLVNGERENAIATLKEGIEQIAVAPQCCVKLVELSLEQGLYRDVIEYAMIGAKETAQEQPSASTGYLYFASALAKDALIHQEAFENCGVEGKGFYNTEAVLDALLDYDIAKSLLKGQGTLLNTIYQRETILNKKSGSLSPLEESWNIAEDRKKTLEEFVKSIVDNNCILTTE